MWGVYTREPLRKFIKKKSENFMNYYFMKEMEKQALKHIAFSIDHLNQIPIIHWQINRKQVMKLNKFSFQIKIKYALSLLRIFNKSLLSPKMSIFLNSTDTLFKLKMCNFSMRLLLAPNLPANMQSQTQTVYPVYLLSK